MSKNQRLMLMIAVIFSIIPLSGCDKSTNPPEDNEFIGNWRWIRSSGGIAGVTITPETEGYDQFLYVTSDSTYSLQRIDTSGSTVTYNGNYYITYEPIWNVNDTGKVIYMGSNQRSTLTISNDSLRIGEICNDCWLYEYVRLGNI